MNLNLYKQIDNRSRIAGSLLFHIGVYTNTSNKKQQRIQALNDADAIIDFCLCMLEDDQAFLRTALMKILNKIVKAKMEPQTLFDFKDEIGFLRILSSIESDSVSG